MSPATAGVPGNDATSGHVPGNVTLRSIVAQWKVMLLIFLFLSALSLTYLNTRPVLYESSAVVSFRPRPGEATGRDLISLLAQTYPELVSSPASIRGAAQAAGVDVIEVRNGLSAAIAPQTLNMSIAVRLADPVAAQKATEYLVDVALDAGAEDPQLDATPVAQADLTDTPAGLPMKLLNLVALMLSAAVALLVGVIVARRRSLVVLTPPGS